jgi:polyferredoxin
MILLSIVCLAYFGFFRSGCVCPIGSVHHVTKALIDPTYPLPFTVAAFFALPLVFALLFGRVFCAGVCPLGAIQDLVLIKPVKVPMWLEHVLWLIPFVYLGSAVLFTVTQTAFIICRYDPFVGFFRMFGPAPGSAYAGAGSGLFHFVGPGSVLIFGGLLLIVAAFVGRPYCRYLCPYRPLLSLCSRFAWRKPSITPDDCVVCSLCEDACPFNAIEQPTPEGVEDE